jgi:hypothetical protein
MTARILAAHGATFYLPSLARMVMPMRGLPRGRFPALPPA